MKLTCNIDQRGRKARIVTGAVVDFVGAGLIIGGIFTHGVAAIAVGAVVSLAGAFMIFEGVRGWCAVRAMGFRTKI